LSFLIFDFRSFGGTPYYIAPEMIRSHTYSFEVDIWAIGIILYALLVGTTPFYSESMEEVFFKIDKGEIQFPQDLIISETAKDLILMILNPIARKFIYNYSHFLI
jgi:cell cycle serine/threonine-protein kinase CDC5/MSD2